MSIGSSLAGQIGWAIETTAGTRVAPTDFVELNSESIALQKNRIERNGMRAGRRLRYGWSAGARQVTGSFEIDLSSNTIGSLLQAAFGAVSTTGSSPYVHTFTPGDLPALTVQVGRPDTTGTVHPFDYVGCRVSAWEISASPDEFAKASVTLAGMDELLDGTTASASYSQGTFFTFVHGALSLGGSDVCIDSIAVTGDNGLNVEHKICAADAGMPTIREAGRREYGGTLQADFSGLTAYERFVDGTEAALTLEFDAGTTAKLEITGNVRFDGDTPSMGAAGEIVKQNLPFVFVSGTSDAAAFTVTLTNTDSTA